MIACQLNDFTHQVGLLDNMMSSVVDDGDASSIDGNSKNSSDSNGSDGESTGTTGQGQEKSKSKRRREENGNGSSSSSMAKVRKTDGKGRTGIRSNS